MYLNTSVNTTLYSKLCNGLKHKDVFCACACVLLFLTFFLTSTLLSFPWAAVLHAHLIMDILSIALPPRLLAPLTLVRNWTFALF